jgi:histidyl-tRNA synthetase
MVTFPKQLLENPSGFPDLSPGEAIALRRMLEVIRTQYELAGYVPIETPLVERPEVLFAKADGEIKQQVYGLRLMNPAAGSLDDAKDLALRYDQTVPLARYVAKNYGKLAFPFRRYVIGPVFRGERAKDGRYRQFIQADIDVIGDGSLNLLHDAEMVSIIAGIFEELAIGSFTIRIGNRKILQGLLQSVGLPEEKLSAASGIIDKIDKIGRKNVIELLTKLEVEEGKAQNLITLLTEKNTVDQTLTSLKSRDLGPLYTSGVQELEKVIEGIRQLGVSEDHFTVDISIARGLDYYTGTVYETRFDAYPDLGSIASGGRYDDLASTFIERDLPGVGISIGVTRLLLRLIKADLMKADATTIAPVIITTAVDVENNGGLYLAQAKRLRSVGIATEIYLVNRQLGKQMQFADRRGFTVAVITREENIANNTVVVRNLKTGDQREVLDEKLVETVQKMLTA